MSNSLMPIRCPCGALLFMATGSSTLESKCQRCKSLLRIVMSEHVLKVERLREVFLRKVEVKISL